MRKNYISTTQEELNEKMILFESSLLNATNKVLDINYNISKFDVINF